MAKTCLIVDDSASMRLLVGFTIKDAGFDVAVAHNGKDALSKIAGVRPDVVITDLNMPEMDGVELIKKIRALPEHKFTPIIMLTTESQESRKQEGRQAGATGWIVKPFTPDKLLEVVRKFVQ